MVEDIQMKELRPILLRTDFRFFLEDCYLCIRQVQFFGQTRNDIDRYKNSLIAPSERSNKYHGNLMIRSDINREVIKNIDSLEHIVIDDMCRELQENTGAFLRDLAIYYRDYVLEAERNKVPGQKVQIEQLIPLLWPTAQCNEYGGPSPMGDIIEVSCNGDWLLFTYPLAAMEYEGAHGWTNIPASKLLMLLQTYRPALEVEYHQELQKFENQSQQKNDGHPVS